MTDINMADLRKGLGSTNEKERLEAANALALLGEDCAPAKDELMKATYNGSEELGEIAADALQCVLVKEDMGKLQAIVDGGHDKHEMAHDLRATFEGEEVADQKFQDTDGKKKASPVAAPHKPSKVRRGSHGRSMAWIVTISDSKGLSESVLENTKDMWEDSLKSGCVSWGAFWDRIDDPEVIRSATPNARRSMLDFLSIKSGDVVVAMLGQKVLAYGTVKPGARYEYCPDDLKHLWQEKYPVFLWLRHILRIDWKRRFGGNGVKCPTSFPLLPACRRPASSGSWAWLREQGIPVDDKGLVDES